LWPIGSQNCVSTCAIGADRAHRQQRDLVVEVDEAFDDHAARIDAAAGSGVVARPLRHRRRCRVFDWPLPDDDITGLTTQGKADLGAGAAFSSSRLLAKR
jgi:hypothetical protein